MCGIIGVIGNVREGEWGQTHHLLTQLFRQAQVRGQDATGFSAALHPYGGQLRQTLLTEKEPLPADQFVATNPFWRQLRHQRCISVLGHVRAATSGSPAVNKNNHPHPLFGGRFALVHNGWFTNVDEIIERYGLRPKTDCDSEVAARLIEEVGGLPGGLYRCLAELKGAQALAVLDGRSGAIWGCTDGNRPLWVARLSDRRRIVLASTPEILERAVEATFGQPHGVISEIQPIAPGYVYMITAEGRITVLYARLFGRGRA